MVPTSVERIKKSARRIIIDAVEHGEIGEDRNWVKRILEEEANATGMREGAFDVLSEGDLFDFFIEAVRFQKERKSAQINQRTYESTSESPRHAPSRPGLSSTSAAFPAALPSPPGTPPRSKDGDTAKEAVHPKAADLVDTELPEYVEIVSPYSYAIIVPQLTYLFRQNPPYLKIVLFNRRDKGHQLAKGGKCQHKRSFISSKIIKHYKLSKFVGTAGTIRLEWEYLYSQDNKPSAVSTLFHVIETAKMNSDVAIGTGWDEEEEQSEDDEQEIEAEESDEYRHLDSPGMLQSKNLLSRMLIGNSDAVSRELIF
jgi:hypothetical protein